MKTYRVNGIEWDTDGNDPKEGVKARTMELLRNHSNLIEEKIDKALNCGAINIEDYDEDYELPRIILHAVMKAMVDETRPLYNSNRKESDNLYLFL